MGSEPPVANDHIGNVLGGTLRLVSRAVAAAFVPKDSVGSPVVRTSADLAWLGNVLSDVSTAHLERGGPWGASAVPAAPGWTMWVEPILPSTDSGHGGDGGEAGEQDGAAAVPAAIGALAVAVQGTSATLTPKEADTVRLFAQLCAGATRAGHRTGEQAHQRRVEELVSRVSERLMSTTLPSLQANLDWTVEQLCRFLGAYAAFLRRNDHVAGMSVLIAEYPHRAVEGDVDPLGVVPFAADPLFAATRDFKVPLIFQNPAADDDYATRVEEATGEQFNFTGAAVPLLHAEVTEGCLGFVFPTEVDWSEHDVNALRAMAALLVQLLHRIDAEERLRHSALTDELTGLANRRALLEEVSRRRMSPAKPLALLFLDLDRFKVMNDYLGHGAGDRLLRVIADRIRTSLRPGDFAARLGGDEFVVLLEATAGSLGAVATAERLLELISLPIDVGGRSVTHTGSIGIAVGDQEQMTGERLLGQADVALYAAKSQGRNRTVVFDRDLQATVASRSDTELQLRKAMSDEAFEVFYQPEFDLRTGRILAVEALLRWRRDGHGLVGAGDFVPVAEETHLITDIDRWVLEQATTQLARWHRVYPDLPLVVRVNVSPAQLAVSGVVETVSRCLRVTGLAPESLCLEITEQAMIRDVDQAVRILHDIRRLGVKLAIDDFGTGFSSMIQLKNLPVDALKIDRVFVDGIADDLTDQAIVDSIIRLAAAFRLDVVAEGIETTADLRTVVRLGCRRAQGYLLSRPLPAEEVEPILARKGIEMATLTSVVPAGSARSLSA